MSDPQPLSGKRALVIGASSGIGRASAHALLAGGAHVTIAGRTEKPLLETVEELNGGDRVGWLLCDAVEGPAVKRAVDQASGDSGLDIAVTIPGGGGYAPILGYGDEEFMEQVRMNVQPQFLALKYAGLSMVASGGGSIVAISSTAAIMSSPYLAAYCSAKAAVDQMIRVAADELGQHGVRVNGVRPGLTRTAGTGGLVDTPEFMDRFLAEQPLQEGGEPDHIAAAVRYLAGPESSWVTGQCLTVDGGHTIRKFPDMTDLARGVFGEERFARVQRGELTD